MEIYLVLHPGSSIIAIAAVLSQRSDMTMEVEKDSLMSSLKFLAAFHAEAKAYSSLSAELSAIFGSLSDCQWIRWRVSPKEK